MPELADADVALLLGLDRAGDFTDAESEVPDLLAAVTPDPTMRPLLALSDAVREAPRQAHLRGPRPNLSPTQVPWPELLMVGARAAERRVRPRTGGRASHRTRVSRAPCRPMRG